jgi:TonB-dependent starch-binding outer membrane protein SusC
VGTNSSYVYGDGANTAFGQQVNTLANPNLRWEITRGINLGVDFTLFNNKLTGTVDYYNNNTTDLIFQLTTPSITGFNAIQSNIGKINNVGLEAALTYNIFNGKNFKWSTTANVWANRNKIKSLTGVDANGDGKEDDLVSSGLFIGRPIGAIFDYQRGNIYGLADTRLPGFQIGTHSVIDQDKNNLIDANDRTFLGQREERYRFSLLNNLNYKGINLSFFLNSIQGGSDGYQGNVLRQYFRDDNNIRNNDFVQIQYWSPRTPNAKYPRNISGSASSVVPNMWESRNFIRLQDVSLGYNLPKKWMDKVKAQSANIYISGKNLVTWTKWDGWDPETGQAMITDGRPVMRAITIGIQVVY